MKKNEKKEIQNYDCPLNQIYFYLTEGCNLACRHCWLSPKHQTEKLTYPSLSVELLQSILEQAKPLGLKGIKLTGGEPLMHPQVHEILNFMQSQELFLNIETNAVLCTPEIAQKISKCKGAFVAVSLDGADAKTHEWVRGVQGCFDGAIRGIRQLVKAKLRPQIIMSVMRHNVEQIEAVVRMAEELGAASVKFNLVQPTGRGEKLNHDGGTLTIKELIELGDWVENSLSPSTNLELYYGQPSAFRPLGKRPHRVSKKEEKKCKITRKNLKKED